MAKCRYLNCVRVATGKNKDGTPKEDCGACRQRHKYWKDKTPGHRLKRRRTLQLSGETMREFVSDTKLKVFVAKEHRKEVKANG